MNINLIKYFKSEHDIELYFDNDLYVDFDIEKYTIGMGYEPTFIKLMNSHPMSYIFDSNTFSDSILVLNMFKTKDVVDVCIIENEISGYAHYEIEIKVETKEGKYDRRLKTFTFDALPLLKGLD
tara:strand:- start:22 stop:393 length:372 start_codon:yes stop_codon:yes gene_type:complete